MRRWSFKPALLRAAQDWRLNGTKLDGPGGHIDLSNVEKAAFVDQAMKGHRFTRLDLMESDRTLSISITSPASGVPDPDREEFFAVLLAVAQVLADRQPGLPVAIGEYGRTALIMFSIGVLSLLFGLGIGFAALASGLSGERLGAAAVPVLLLVAFGGTLGWARRPWKPALQISAASLPLIFEAYSGAAQPKADASAAGE